MSVDGHGDRDADPGGNGRPGPPARVLLWLLDFYQKGISPLTPPSCRFEPTCSAYAVEAVRVHGAVRGSALAGWRVLRCAPWSRGGWDPVPPRAGVADNGDDGTGPPDPSGREADAPSAPDGRGTTPDPPDTDDH